MLIKIQMSSFRGTNLTLCSRNNKFMIIGLEDSLKLYDILKIILIYA